MWRCVRRDFHTFRAAQKKELFHLLPLFPESHPEIQPEVQWPVELRRPDSICGGARLLYSNRVLNSLKQSNGRTGSFQFGVHEHVDMSALFQRIAALALKLPHYVKKVDRPARSTGVEPGSGDRGCVCFQSIPLLQRGCAAAITLSQVQISCLLANAFFCTFPRRNSTSPHSEYHSYPSINFTRWDRRARRTPRLHHLEVNPSSPSVCRLFSHWSEWKMEKLKAIVHYFQVVTDESESVLDSLFTNNISERCQSSSISAVCVFLLCWELTRCLCAELKLDGLVTFERRCLADTDVHIWKR